MKDERILRRVERDAEEHVRRALVHEQREASLPHEDLEEGVAGRERGVLDLSWIPGRHQVPTAGRVAADPPDQVRELVDAPATGRVPVAPLLPVVAAGVALEARPGAPGVGA